MLLLAVASLAVQSPSPANQINESVTLTPRPRCAVLIGRHVAKNAGSRAAVEPPFGTWRVTTLGGPRPYPVIHTEAALLAWLDERTELGFEVASDQLASWCAVWEVLLSALLCRVPSESR